jgi:nucleoid-associated protein YgaU
MNGAGPPASIPTGNSLNNDPLFVQVGTNSGTGDSTTTPLGPSSAPLLPPNGQSISGFPTPLQRSGGRSRPQSSDYVWHVIQPNQSLESISLQYLGDRSQVSRLLELNRDLLSDPTLLPIGKAIRIPIR